MTHVVTKKSVEVMQALFVHNSAIIDSQALVNPSVDAIEWYPRAWDMIRRETEQYGFDARITARVLSHLSIATKWDRQVRTLPIVVKTISDMIITKDKSTVHKLYPATLYAKSAVYAVENYIDSVTPIVDTPKKTVQFYNAIISGDTHWYVSDSIDLQLKGLLMHSEEEQRLVKHTAIDNAMGSVLMYKSQLKHERSLQCVYPPTIRQAIRWIYYQNNKVALRTNMHEHITYDYIECPFSDTPMIKWRMR